MEKIKNAIIIDGVTYELVESGDMYGRRRICSQCDLLKQCSEHHREHHDAICGLFHLSGKVQYYFKKVNADCEHASENNNNKS